MKAIVTPPVPHGSEVPFLQSWSCIDCGFVGMGRNCLNAVYNHVEKETVAGILDLEVIKSVSSCVDNTNLKVEQKSILVRWQPVLWIRIRSDRHYFGGVRDLSVTILTISKAPILFSRTH